LGGESVAGGKMKVAVGTSWYDHPYAGATNESLFTGFPGGYRSNTSGYFGFRSDGAWWSTTENNTSDAWDRSLSYEYGSVYRGYNLKKYGFSVRCLRD
jgi:uncharacterized protein (TIGR02145 family)